MQKTLNVHANHLNRAVKEVTGKPTTTHISERIISEAKALLQHTDWNIAEIAYALGFEYPTYFNNFFKKITGTNPKISFRISLKFLTIGLIVVTLKTKFNYNFVFVINAK